MDIYVFPYEKIKEGSRVVIYGAGSVGKRYVEQIMSNGYCKLVCVVDKQAETLRSDMVKLAPPDILATIEFDNLIIAIKGYKTAKQIKRELIKKYNIPGGKIVWKENDKYLNVPQKYIWSVLPNHLEDSDEILISANIGAGFGDTIISKKIIDTMGRLAGPKCRIDIYIHDNTYNFAKGLFRGSTFVKNVYRESAYSFYRYFQSYDLSIIPNYILAIEHCDYDSLSRKNRAFAQCIAELQSYLDRMGLKNIYPWDNSVLYARAKKTGCNAYTVHSCGGILPIKDTKVEIPLLPEFEEEYHNVFSKKCDFSYITLNYGWGMNKHEKNYVPCKIWPFEYYVRFAEMVKEKYPSIKVVQIARGGAPRIPFIDVLLKDLDMEVLKYVLRDSLLHVDSEGGMVHLATQLNTKCLVAFGPTPVHFFGYTSNINVVSENCSNCCFLDADFTKCLRGMSEPECMYSITPEVMFEKFENYMRDLII